MKYLVHIAIFCEKKIKNGMAWKICVLLMQRPNPRNRNISNKVCYGNTKYIKDTVAL